MKFGGVQDNEDFCSPTQRDVQTSSNFFIVDLNFELGRIQFVGS